LLSLKACGFSGDLCLFVSDVDDASIAALRAGGAIVEHFETYRFMTMDLSTARYVRYYEYLAARPGIYDAVILSDTRDVVFQGDPGAICGPEDLCFFLESGHTTIADCPWNSRWLRTGFGDSALAELGGFAISCSGVTVGGAARIADYIATLVQIATDCSAEAQALKGFDQAVHNVILRKNLIDGIRLVPNHGPVMSLGYAKDGEFRLSADGTILNPDGSASAIVHQYDRHQGLRDAIFAIYGVEPERCKA
jgi:hypothetical protein